MNSTLEALKFIAKNDYVVVNNVVVEEVTEVLKGLGVKFDLVKVDAENTSIVKN